MTAMQTTAPQPSRSNAVLAAMLLLGNLAFMACVASRCGALPADWLGLAGQPDRIAWARN